jgi:catechol 2,3-dioxygenase-like lactoylglutathione lyase family enzyme
MSKNSILITAVLFSFSLGFFANTINEDHFSKKKQHYAIKKASKKALRLGAFSISLNVKDLKVSKDFYEQLGFKILGGAMDKNYLIMKNGNALIGLFYGSFEGNILTFNPGWDENANNISEFDDVRTIQKQLKENNIKLTVEADEKSSGPGFIMLNDPDGNVIFIDQHR